MRPCRLIALVPVLIATVLATAALSQPRADAPERTELKRTDLSGAPGMEVISSISEYMPGSTIPLHFHHGIETVYVLQGSTVQLPGKDPMPMPAGASFINLRGVAHAGFKIVGDTPLKLLTVHVVDKAKPLYDVPQ